MVTDQNYAEKISTPDYDVSVGGRTPKMYRFKPRKGSLRLNMKTNGDTVKKVSTIIVNKAKLRY
jgi:hypothetical protein